MSSEDEHYDTTNEVENLEQMYKKILEENKKLSEKTNKKPTNNLEEKKKQFLQEECERVLKENAFLKFMSENETASDEEKFNLACKDINIFKILEGKNEEYKIQNVLPSAIRFSNLDLVKYLCEKNQILYMVNNQNSSGILVNGGIGWEKEDKTYIKAITSSIIHNQLDIFKYLYELTYKNYQTTQKNTGRLRVGEKEQNEKIQKDNQQLVDHYKDQYLFMTDYVHSLYSSLRRVEFLKYLIEVQSLKDKFLPAPSDNLMRIIDFVISVCLNSNDINNIKWLVNNKDLKFKDWNIIRHSFYNYNIILEAFHKDNIELGEYLLSLSEDNHNAFKNGCGLIRSKNLNTIKHCIKYTNHRTLVRWYVQSVDYNLTEISDYLATLL